MNIRSVDKGPDDTEIAGEYVLRVLPADAHRAAAVRAATDPVFAAEIRAWEDRLVPLTDDIDPITPLPTTKVILMDRLFGLEGENSTGTRAVIWQALTVLGFAAAAALAVFAFVPQDVGPIDDTRFVAELASNGDALRILALYDPATGNVQVTRTNGSAGEGRSLQLWGIVEGNDPVSIGVLPDASGATIALPEALVPNAAALVLAVSDEPLGGSPTGQPTGAVLATSPVNAL